MGYDVTFHPVSAADAQYFVFDVMEKPSLAEERAAQISTNPEMRKKVPGLYEDMLAWRNPKTWREDVGFGAVVGYFTAIFVGFLHPHWYARQAAITWLGKYEPFILSLFLSWRSVADGYVSRLPDDSAGILGLNYTGSGYIPPVDVPKLDAIVRDMMVVRENRPYFDKLADPTVSPIHHIFDSDGLAALLHAIEYAEKEGLGLMEASEVVVSVGGALLQGTASDPDQFRSALTDNLDDLTNPRGM